MLKTIADLSPQLIAFTLSLQLSLSRPQLRHVTRVADALITTEGSKTLSAVYRHIVDDPCPKAAADTFREAPWSADDSFIIGWRKARFPLPPTPNLQYPVLATL